MLARRFSSACTASMVCTTLVRSRLSMQLVRNTPAWYVTLALPASVPGGAEARLEKAPILTNSGRTRANSFWGTRGRG